MRECLRIGLRRGRIDNSLTPWENGTKPEALRQWWGHTLRHKVYRPDTVSAHATLWGCPWWMPGSIRKNKSRFILGEYYPPRLNTNNFKYLEDQASIQAGDTSINRSRSGGGTRATPPPRIYIWPYTQICVILRVFWLDPYIFLARPP